MARGDVPVDGDRPLPIATGDRLQRGHLGVLDHRGERQSSVSLLRLGESGDRTRLVLDHFRGESVALVF